MNKISTKIIFVIMALYYLSGTLYLTDTWRFLQPILLIATTSIIFGSIFILNTASFEISGKALFLFALSMFLFTVASLVNQDVELLKGTLLLTHIYLSVSFVLPKILLKFKINIESVVVDSFLVVHLALLMMTLFLYPIRASSYSGMFYNPNSMGGISATVFAILLAKFLYKIEVYMTSRTIKIKNIVRFIIAMLFVFLLVVVSSSRTSFIAVFFLTLIGFILTIKNTKINQNISVSSSRLFSVLIILISIMFIFNFFINIPELINVGVLEKFEAKSNDLLDDRLVRWLTLLSEAKMFGYGRSYFEILGLGSAHNTFFSLMGQYGYLPTSFFVLFLLKLLINSIRFVKTNYSYKYMPIFSLATFIALSTTEGMMLKASMLLVFSTIGIMNLHMKGSEAVLIRQNIQGGTTYGRISNNTNI